MAKKTGWIIAIIIIVILVIIGIAMMSGGKKANGEKGQPTPPPIPTPITQPTITPTTSATSGSALDVLVNDASDSESDDSISLSTEDIISAPQ